jgi:hypothetical protein
MTDTTTLPPVIEGIELVGGVNTPETQICANIAASIRRGHPQLRRQEPQMDRVVLVGGGPSLLDTEDELVALIRSGAKLVTVNGAYQWALARNLFPKTQFVMDAREGNSRFLHPEIPGCHYVLSSQCAPSTWDAVAGRERVWIFHSVSRHETDVDKATILDRYYLKAWETVGGGSTVVTRAIFALRMLGYLRFDLFGVDCSWKEDQHHAYPQPENEKDSNYMVRVAPSDALDHDRIFRCSGWHLKQYEDMLEIIRHAGHHFLLNVHGDGLLAHTLRVKAELSDIIVTKE